MKKVKVEVMISCLVSSCYFVHSSWRCSNSCLQFSMTFLLWAKRENKPMNGCSDLTVDSSKPAYSDTWKRGRKGNDCTRSYRWLQALGWSHAVCSLYREDVFVCCSSSMWKYCLCWGSSPRKQRCFFPMSEHHRLKIKIFPPILNSSTSGIEVKPQHSDN